MVEAGPGAAEWWAIADLEPLKEFLRQEVEAGKYQPVFLFGLQ